MKKRKSIILISAVTLVFIAIVCIGIFIYKKNDHPFLLINERGLKVEITEINYKKDEVRLKLTMNNYGEDDMKIHCGTNGYSCNSINGYMNSEGYLITTVKAGSKKSSVITFSRDKLKMYGIDKISEIELGINVQNDNTKECIYYSPIKVTIPETEEDTATTNSYNQHIQNAKGLDYYVEEEIYNYNDIIVKSVAFISNADGDNTVLLEVVNNSSEIAYGMVSDVVVNGMLLHENQTRELRINPGKTRIFEYSLSEVMNTEVCKILGIDKIGEFNCNLTLRDGDNSGKQTSINITNPDANQSVDTSGTEVYNENGIRIISKGIIEDYNGYDEYAHLLLLVENNHSELIGVSNKSFYMDINEGYLDLELPIYDIPYGCSFLLDFEINMNWIEESDIVEYTDIKRVGMSLRLTDKNREVISEPEIVIRN